MRGIRVSFWVCVVFLTGAIGATPAEAQQIAPGVQGGVSIDPNQFYFGGHIETSELIDRAAIPAKRRCRHRRRHHGSGNFEFTYTFPGGRPWNLYVGGGPAINWYDSTTAADRKAASTFSAA